jgi:tRNA (guanine-N7-)-methyltransferase
VPHFIASSLNIPDIPFQEDGIFFEYEACNNNHSLVSVNIINENRKFLLHKKIRDDGSIIIKSDKPTRTNQLFLIKKALLILQQKAKIIHSNLKEHKDEKVSPYFKNAKYFLDTLSYDKKISIEIGFGSGRHLLYQAKNNKKTLFIGIEIHNRSIEQLLKQLKLQEIENVLVIKYDSRIFLEFLKSNSIDNIFIHFPVPWDKKEHRRVFSTELIQNAKRVLSVNGVLDLRTDSKNYFTYVKELYTKLNYEVLIEKNSSLEIVSKYEDRWRKQNKDIYNITFKNKFISDDTLCREDFLFEEKIHLDNIESLIKHDVLVYEKYFVNFQRYYKIENSGYLLKVSFGDFNKPEHTYIEIIDKRAKYFLDKPISSSANMLSHKNIKELLCSK